MTIRAGSRHLRGELESQALGNQLRRVLDVWGLSASGSRPPLWSVAGQALSKWLAWVIRGRQDAGGVRPRRRHGPSRSTILKTDRVPAAVRRKAARLGFWSLIDLVESGDTQGVVDACRAMFDFASTQA